MKKFICKICGKEGECKSIKKSFCDDCYKSIHRENALRSARKKGQKYKQKNIVNGINKTKNLIFHITDEAWSTILEEARHKNMRIYGYYTRKNIIFLNNSERIIFGETLADLIQKIRE